MGIINGHDVVLVTNWKLTLDLLESRSVLKDMKMTHLDFTFMPYMETTPLLFRIFHIIHVYVSYIFSVLFHLWMFASAFRWHRLLQPGMCSLDENMTGRLLRSFSPGLTARGYKFQAREKIACHWGIQYWLLRLTYRYPPAGSIKLLVTSIIVCVCVCVCYILNDCSRAIRCCDLSSFQSNGLTDLSTDYLLIFCGCLDWILRGRLVICL